MLLVGLSAEDEGISKVFPRLTSNHSVLSNQNDEKEACL